SPCTTLQPLYLSSYFFFNTTATTETYTLSLHDALPIYSIEQLRLGVGQPGTRWTLPRERRHTRRDAVISAQRLAHRGTGRGAVRSEEHTSELQSRSDLVCRLLLEKKKQKRHNNNTHITR